MTDMIQDTPKKRVCVLIPTYRVMPCEFFTNFLNFLSVSMGKYVMDVVTKNDIPVDKARNELVEAALAKNPDFIFFLDSDMMLPANILDKLIKDMEESKADLVTALYFSKSKPYYPIIREYHSGGFWKIENPALGQLIEIGGCGMGCALVKPEVFRKTDYPWFAFSYEKWGYKEIQLSEDLWFCRQLVRNRLKMVCDTGIVASHLGGAVDVMEYMSFAVLREEVIKDREECAEDIVEFTGLDREEIDMRIMVGPDRLAEEWNSKSPKTDGEIRNFYKETENYLYDLFLWHFTERRQFDVELVTAMERDKPKNILDLGCGIGQNGFMLARKGFDVTIADLSSKTLDFAKFRFNKHDLPCKVWEIDCDPMPPVTFDVILCFDVLEHLPKEELKKTVETLIKLKDDGTKVYNTTSFGKTNIHPMHFDADEETKALIEKLLNSFS